MRLLAAAWLPALAACYVPVTHTPRIDPGLAVTGGFTLSYGHPDSAKPRLPNPAALIAMSFGTHFGGGNRVPGLQITDVISVWDGLMLDGYLQAPKALTGSWDIGAGGGLLLQALYGGNYYVQLGHELQNGYYVYTTQAVSYMRREGERNRSPWWQPMFAIQRPTRDDGRPPLRYFATMTFGPTRTPCSSEIGCPFQQASSIAIGVIASVSLHGGFRPVPLPRR
jgi:hypothetical protein